MAATEMQPAIYAGDPQSTNVATLGQLLDQLDAIIWSDGMFGPDEQRLFGAFMAKQKMKIQAMAQQQAQAQGAAQPNQGFTPQQRTPPLNEQPMQMGYGTGGGSEYVP